MESRQIKYGGATINLYFDSHAFDFIILPEDEAARNKAVESLIRQICVSLPLQLARGSTFQSFYISSVVTAPGANSISILYNDDKNIPEIKSLPLNSQAKSSVEYNLRARADIDIDVYNNKNKRGAELKELNDKQRAQANQYFLAGNIPAAAAPPSIETLRQNQIKLVNQRAAQLFENYNKQPNIDIQTITAQLNKMITDTQKSLDAKRKQLQEELASAALNIDLAKAPPEIRDEINTKLQEYARQTSTNTESLFESEDKALTEQQTQITKLNQTLYENNIKRKAQIAEHIQNSLPIKIAALHAMHLAAQEAFELLRTNKTDNREILRNKFNERFGGFAYISEFGKLEYKGDNLIHLPLQDFQAKISSALQKTEPTALEKVMNIVRTEHNDFAILQRQLSALGADVKIDGTSFTFSAQHFKAEWSAGQAITKQGVSLEEETKIAYRQISAINPSDNTRKTLARSDAVTRNAILSFNLYAQSIKLQHRAKNELNDAIRDLQNMRNLAQQALRVQKALVEKFAPDSQIRIDASKCVAAIQENVRQAEILIAELQSRNEEIQKSVNFKDQPSPTTILAWNNHTAELIHHISNTCFGDNNTGIITIKGNQYKSFNQLYNETSELERKLNNYESNLELFAEAQALNSQVNTLIDKLTSTRSSHKKTNEAFANFENMQQQDYIFTATESKTITGLHTKINELMLAIESNLKLAQELQQQINSQIARTDIPEDKHEAHVENIKNKITQLKALQSKMNTDTQAIAVYSNQLERLQNQIAGDNRNIMAVCKDVADMVQQTSFWSEQIILTGGSKVGPDNIRVPTGIALMIKKIAEYDNDNPNWRNNPADAKNLLEDLQRIARDRIPKQSNLDRLKLFANKEIPDKESKKFYKMLSSFKLQQISETNYAEIWRSQLHKNFSHPATIANHKNRHR